MLIILSSGRPDLTVSIDGDRSAAEGLDYKILVLTFGRAELYYLGVMFRL